VLGMLAGGLLSVLHGVITISFQAEQVVSGLALTFLGTGLARVLGEDLSKAGAIALLPTATVPVVAAIPVVGPIFFTDQSVLVYLGYVLVPVIWWWINRTRPGLHLRAIGESPTAADTLGVNVYRLRYAYVIAGGILAGLGGATIVLAISPGWFSDLTTNGQGWVAVALVIFARWNPLWAPVGAYLWGALTRLTYDIQGPTQILGFPNPIFYNHSLTFFLEMLPWVLVIVVLVAVSGESLRKRIGAPAALGIPYSRGERGQ
jgi:general nucleoside transport system permease protein